jgi:hypothetical protein
MGADVAVEAIEMPAKKTSRSTQKKKPPAARPGRAGPARGRGKGAPPPRSRSGDRAGDRANDRGNADADGDRADQLGAIIAKGMDLAEAGLSLGLTIIGRVGAVAQRQLLSRISLASEAAAAAPRNGPGDPQAAAGTEADSSDVRAAQEQQFFITNRLPVAPGGAVTVSFSINNDAIATRKKVSLSVEGFAGEHGGGRLAGEHFAVRPASKTIEPMDFEKFILAGTVPPEIAPDVYNGWIMVKTDSEFRIPVRLVVVAP